MMHLQEAYEFAQTQIKISPAQFMRKFQINYQYAQKLCREVKKMNWFEARELAKKLEYR